MVAAIKPWLGAAEWKSAWQDAKDRITGDISQLALGDNFVRHAVALMQTSGPYSRLT
jgi:hypothetical protein